MRLYFKLSEQQKLAAIKRCTQEILQDLILEQIHFDPVSDTDFMLFDTIMEAMDYIKGLPTQEEKINYLMSQQIVCDTIREIAISQASNCVYLDDDEIPVYVSSLDEQEKLLASPPATPVAEEDLEDEFFDLKTHTVKNKNPYGVN